MTRRRSSRSSSSRARSDAREGVPRRYRARVEYDGTDFAGFQVQPGKRTVQGVLEDALAGSATGPARRVDGAGRTDAGVHATRQVIAFSYDGRLATAELERALDALLPPDVAIRGLRRAPTGFNPRYAARYREYRYTVWNGPRSPLRERTALGVRVPLDTAAMARAGSVFDRPARLQRLRGDGPLTGPDRACGPGPAGRPARDDRRPGRRLPAGDGPPHGGRPPGGRHGKMDEDAVRAALADPRPAIDGAAAPAKGLCLRRVAIGRTAPERTTENDEER